MGLMDVRSSLPAEVCTPAVRVARENGPASVPGGRRKTKGILMGSVDKAKNKAEEMEGQAKQKVGEATGNESQQAEGQAEQTAANLKQAGEKVKDAFK
jgi:uncharacterized protein YjbJ (UPF0337 family)